MKFLITYFSTVFKTLKSVLSGLKLTGYYFTHHSKIVTQQYPDNRDTLKLPERFRGEVVLIHDENNEHRCTGCSACDIACPNHTIRIISKRELTEDGKNKKRIDQFVYNLSMCTFCNLCIEACPTDAIKMSNDFEHSVYDRKELTKILNKPGSKLVKELD